MCFSIYYISPICVVLSRMVSFSGFGFRLSSFVFRLSAFSSQQLEVWESSELLEFIRSTRSIDYVCLCLLNSRLVWYSPMIYSQPLVVFHLHSSRNSQINYACYAGEKFTATFIQDAMLIPRSLHLPILSTKLALDYIYVYLT